MSIAHSRSFNKAICEALGLDPAKVYRIVIDLHASREARIRIKQYASVDGLETVTRLLRLGHWEPGLEEPA